MNPDQHLAGSPVAPGIVGHRCHFNRIREFPAPVHLAIEEHRGEMPIRVHFPELVRKSGFSD
jgi:hypothetical protein